MKKLSILLFWLIVSQAYAQESPEKEIKSKVNEVTVFIEGAQVVRKKSVELNPGRTTLKFTNLSPFIDAKSVQVKANGAVTVLSVNHQQNYIKKMKRTQEIVDLESRLEILDDKMLIEKTYLAIIRDELIFLNENRVIRGSDQELNIDNLKEASSFYGSRLTSLKLDEIKRNKVVVELQKEKNDINNQIRTLTSIKEFPSGEIFVKVKAERGTNAKFELSYVVGNAGWFPSYDIRTKNISEPVELIYKANVRQDTKVDWENVKLSFSSSDPNISGVAPKLMTYFLDYFTQAPRYGLVSNSVRGRVADNQNQPLPGVNVIVEGTTIGSISDINGNYSITIPNNAQNLVYSFIGFESQKLPITNSVINVNLIEDLVSLDEVVVIGYGSIKKRSITGALQGRTPGVSVKDKNQVMIRGTNSLAVPSSQVVKQTTVDFEIETPYTIKSDNKSYTVDMEVYSLPAFYQYYCVPKIDKDAFLMANITDWEKYNLLEGEANIFFEETYIGKTLLDVRYAEDTLQISLGRDKNVSVNREKIKDFTTKQFIGSKKEETRAWLTTVKNNKSQEINMMILDQVPVSTLEEIEILVQKISGAKHDVESGEIKWEFTLKPKDKKELELKYSVKYPKNRKLIIE